MIIANLKGNYLVPNLKGTAQFHEFNKGSLLRVEVYNLPSSRYASKDTPPINPFGFHIHEGASCSGPDFKAAKGHFNPTNEPHPFHAGDLPVLLSNNGYSYMVVYTDRFKPKDVLGKTVIIHQNPDDYRSQPTGASGSRIACGVIKKI